MARHDQRSRPRSKWICSPCKEGLCNHCVDVLRTVYTNYKLCDCDRPEHSGDPTHQQILDPDTGTVHAPGLTVTIDGEVKLNETE